MDMSHATSTMAMVMGGDATSTAGSAAAATTSAAMEMDMGAGSCKISMLWNWNVVDSCFIAKSWQIRSKGMFAGSCIGVILLVMTLELLRRASQEYDRFLIRQHEAHSHTVPSMLHHGGKTSSDDDGKGVNAAVISTPSARTPFRPSLIQQAIRASLHTVQFTIAYFVMLLAMYYNGYIIISIIIGAWLGAFVFSWQALGSGGPKEDSTYCCG